MWVQCPYQEILSVLEYLEAERSTNPYDVRALLIVPQYESTGYDSTPTKIKNLVKYYELVHTYPPGTYMYSTLENIGYSTKGNQMIPLKPTNTPINVYLIDLSKSVLTLLSTIQKILIT